MITLLRRLLRIPPPSITPAQAVDLAKAEARRLGRPWQEPIRVVDRLREYVIWTNSETIGGNLNVFVDIHTGEITAVRGPMRR